MCPVLANSLILMFLSQIYRTQSKTKMNLRKQHTPAVSSMPKKLTTRLSIKVEEKLYISQNITERYIQIILFEYRRLRERKAWISSHFKSLPVATMT